MRFGNASAEWDNRVLSRRLAWTDRRQRRHHVAGNIVVPAVITPLHNDDVISSGKRACKADGLIRRLASGIHNLHRVHKGNRLADQLGETALETRGVCAKET